MRLDYEPFMKVLSSTNSQFYDCFSNYLDDNKFICCNMMITTKDILDEYMNFLFSLILQLSEISKPNKSNLRREGWISEFIFGAWLNYTQKRKYFMNINKFTKNLHKTEFYVIDPTKQVLI